jgi:hypothetical protein
VIHRLAAGGRTAVWSRAEAISRLRDCLVPMTDGETSMCRVAAEQGIFCRGFRRWSVPEFDRRWRDFIGRSTHLSRAQMEEYANIWQLSEQVACGVSLACDAAAGVPHQPCRGWSEFSNDVLAQFCSDLLGANVEVVS